MTQLVCRRRKEREKEEGEKEEGKEGAREEDEKEEREREGWEGGGWQLILTLLYHSIETHDVGVHHLRHDIHLAHEFFLLFRR